eukprot:Lankesteria_metandrocarpae@DN3063_c0_g1_i1.p1
MLQCFSRYRISAVAVATTHQLVRRAVSVAPAMTFAATAGSSRSSAATAASSNGSICSPIVGGVGGCSRRRNVTAVKYRTANSRMNTTAGTAISTAAKLLNSIQHIHVLQTQQQIC